MIWELGRGKDGSRVRDPEMFGQTGIHPVRGIAGTVVRLRAAGAENNAASGLVTRMPDPVASHLNFQLLTPDVPGSPPGWTAGDWDELRMYGSTWNMRVTLRHEADGAKLVC